MFRFLRRHRLFAGGIFLSAAMLSLPSTVHAAEKRQQFSLKQSYSNCEFVIRCSDVGAEKYSYYVISPDGETYEAEWYADGSARVGLYEIGAGDWVVVVNNNHDKAESSEAGDEGSQSGESGEGEGETAAEETPPAEESTGETSGGENTGETADGAESRSYEDDDVIGEVNITLNQTSARRDVSSLDNRIGVAKELNGFKIYFDDDDVVTVWDDDSVKSVNIRVFDTKTMEILAQKNVRDQYMSARIPEGVQQITISVTPATAERVSGAERMYTVTVDNNPDMHITFPEYEFTNTSRYLVHVDLGLPYSIEVYNNGDFVQELPGLDAGDYNLALSLQEGQNDIKVYVVDQRGYKRSASASVILDTKAPALMIETNVNGLVTEAETVTFRGRAEAYDILKFNNQEDIEPSYDGTFTVEAPLEVGVNKFLIRAEDLAGNFAEYPAEVTRVEPVPPRFTPKELFAYILCGIISLVWIVVRVATVQSHRKMAKSAAGEEAQEEKPEKPKKKKKEKKERKHHFKRFLAQFFGFLIFILPVVILVVLMRFFLITSIVQSESMEPTIMTGDLVVANAMAYKAKAPERGDIIIFSNDDTLDRLYVKRVIGLPGDHVEFKNGFVYVNDRRCVEDYISEDIETNSGKVFDVPGDSLFVLGDNRENSIDSRYLPSTYVKIGDVVGRVTGDYKLPWK